MVLEFDSRQGALSYLVLDSIVGNAIRKSRETGLPVGLGGHTATCEMNTVEVAPDCYSCASDPGWSGPCRKGLQRGEDMNSSAYFEKTSEFCPGYELGEFFQCSCSSQRE